MKNHLLALPNILVIDDVLGRQTPGPNVERRDFCGHLLLRDRTLDSSVVELDILSPVAEARFIRGQFPVQAKAGDLVVNDLETVVEVVSQGWHQRPPGVAPWALVIVDLCFLTGRVFENSDPRQNGIPRGFATDLQAGSYFGLEILHELQSRFPGLPMVVLSGMDRGEVGRELALRGGLAFLDKGSPTAAARLAEILDHHGFFPDPQEEIVGHSLGLLQALRTARRAAGRDGTVLIRGETGTGKDLVARFIHRLDGARQAGPFVPVDAGILSPELYGSELFGHRRGAFTGAIADRGGWIEQANGGTLFLDEIGNLPEGVQSGLLRTLETREVVALGSRVGRAIDVRVLSATNVDIESRAAGGQGFRLDLLERLRTAGTIILPPLRSRPEDLPLLIERFVRDAENTNPRAVRRTIDPSALEVLALHSWPGNIRELRSCLSSAVLDHPSIDHLVAGHLRIADGHPKIFPVAIHEEFRPTSMPSCPGHLPESVPDLVGFVNRIEADSFSSQQLQGALPLLLQACGDLLGRVLRRAAELQSRPSLKSPNGELLPQPTLQWLCNDSSLDATAAYDLILRLRKIAGSDSCLWNSDPILQELVERSRSRRRRPTATAHLSKVFP